MNSLYVQLAKERNIGQCPTTTKVDIKNVRIFGEMQRKRWEVNDGELGFWLNGAPEIYANGTVDICRCGNEFLISSIDVKWKWIDQLDAKDYGTLAWNEGLVFNSRSREYDEIAGGVLWTGLEGTVDFLGDRVGGAWFDFEIKWNDKWQSSQPQPVWKIK